MKLKLICFLIYFSLQFCDAQKSVVSKTEWLANHAIEVKSISVENTDFSDLENLKNLLKDKQIVLLGEQSHGGGSTYSAKVRLVKFLHQEMGFEVMAFESGMYDCAKIARQMELGSTLIKEKTNSMFYMYSNSTEIEPLFNYIDAHKNTETPLLFTGMDSQHTGEKSQSSMLNDLASFLNMHNSKIPNTENWQLFIKKTNEIFKMQRTITNTEKLLFYKTLEDIKKQLITIPSTNTNLLEDTNFWLQIMASITSQAKRYWGDIDDIDRDRQMADNMSWLINNPFKGKKVIIWAHNFHIAKKVDNIKPMGYYLKKEFNKKMYSIGFIGYEGAYIDFVSGKNKKIKKPKKGSLEYSIKNTGIKNAIVDFNNLFNGGLWLKKPLEGRLANFNTYKAIYPDIFDGIFYIEQTTPTIQK
ncbi:erythromycin esterase family protein [Aquimarina longa]|uniref:erythromycin esterase family protein n=1 Tax=Aquimarina longa TaxID=1080221 RepID=UPI0007861230|nr:erythromycin esterase family protein [Aquimarina longa]